VSSPADLAGEGLGRGLWATRVRFGALDRGGAAPARELGGARECGRGSGCSRQGCGSVGLVSGTASYCRDRGCGRTSLGARGWPGIGAHRGWP
jgi:hypothetical protein